MSFLRIENVKKTFRARGRVVNAVDGVSMDVPRGASLGIVGESGSGKTTLARIMQGLLPPDGGTVAIDGRSRADDPSAWAKRVQTVYQDPASSLNPKLRVRTQLSESFRLRDGGYDAERHEAEARALLADLGLEPEALDRYPHAFSGGQRQRIAMARALAVRPEVLIADEPVSSLDLSIQAQILNLLLDQKDKRGLTLVVISHDLAVVGSLSDRVAVMKDGRVVETGPAERVLSRPEHPYTETLLAATPAMAR